MPQRASYQYKHLTATAVVAGSSTAGQNVAGPTVCLHTIALNNVAATAVVNVYDDVQTAAPNSALLVASFTAPTGGINGTHVRLDAQMKTGIAVTIATAAADITITYG